MDKKTSLYLDFLRVIATLGVFIGHFAYTRFSGTFFSKIGIFSHDSVIIFFVLSGYVIAYVSENKDKSMREYFSSRAARIYSVLIPAMILTLLLDNIGISFNKSNYEGYIFVDVVKRIIANGFFLQEVWNQSIRFFSNGPLWSLGYEIIYYIIFGILFYNRKSKIAKIGIASFIILFYKVSLLLPIWLLGVLAYKIRDKKMSSKKGSCILFILTIITYLLLKRMGILTTIYFKSLGYSCYIIGDYIIGLLLFVNIICIKNMNLNILFKFSSLIKGISGFSFSIYLFHFPMLVFITSIFNYNKNNFISVTLVGILVLSSCFILSLVTEKKKYLYKKMFRILFRVKEQPKVIIKEKSFEN